MKNIKTSFLDFTSESIKYFGKLTADEEKWLIRTGKKSYSGGELRPIFIDGEMIGGIYWNLGGIDYIEFLPKYKNKGYLRKIVMDNVENGVVKFVSASPELTAKLSNYGKITYDYDSDITTVKINENSNFKNNGKVVDQDGNLLTVYHGTDSGIEFNEFDGNRGIGWFTSNEEYAQQYVRDEGRLMKFNLIIKNPYILTLSPEELITLQEFNEITGIQTKKKYSDDKYLNEKRPAYDWYNPTYTDFLTKIEYLGYDGLQTLEQGKYICWLPLYNDQIVFI